MALKRFIHPEFFSSGDVASLGPWARLLWLGLFGKVADDEGRGKAEPPHLKAEVFALDGSATIPKVRGWLEQIHERAMIVLYRDERDRLLFEIPTWSDWQRPRYVKPSKFKPYSDFPNSGKFAQILRVGRVGLGREKKEGAGKENPTSGTGTAEPDADAVDSQVLEQPATEQPEAPPKRRRSKGGLQRVEYAEGIEGLRKQMEDQAEKVKAT